MIASSRLAPLVSWVCSPLLFVALAGCGSASASGSAKASTDDAFAVEGDAAWDTVESDLPPSEGSAARSTATAQGSVSASGSVSHGSSGAEPVLLGARHDVTVASGAPATCKCLAVVLGAPNHPRLTWTAARPVLDPAQQLVIALASENVSCDVADAPGASYMGYTREGANVVVQVEAARPGRPITHGAIIPRPAAGGQVFLQGSGKIPYGTGLQGEARCALGTGQ